MGPPGGCCWSVPDEKMEPRGLVASLSACASLQAPASLLEYNEALFPIKKKRRKKKKKMKMQLIRRHGVD